MDPMVGPYRQYPLNCPAYERDTEAGNLIRESFEQSHLQGTLDGEAINALAFQEDGSG